MSRNRIGIRQISRLCSAGGTEAAYLPDADAIATHVVATAKPGDVICVLSNGGFGGVLEKLLVGLKA